MAGVWFWNLPLYFKYEIKLFDRFYFPLWASSLAVLFTALPAFSPTLSGRGCLETSVLYFSSSLCQHFLFAYPNCINGSSKPLLTELFRGKLLPNINRSSQSYLHIPHCKYRFLIFRHLYFSSMNRMPTTIMKVKNVIYIKIQMALNKTKVI